MLLINSFFTSSALELMSKTFLWPCEFFTTVGNEPIPMDPTDVLVELLLIGVTFDAGSSISFRFPTEKPGIIVMIICLVSPHGTL